MGKSRAAEDNAFDPNYRIGHSEENDVISDNGEPGVVSNVWAELIELRAIADPADRFANFADKADRTTGIVFS